MVRDLHDGAQQRLVHTVITLKLARQALLDEKATHAPALVSEALEHAEHATAELRELAHGILPSVLTHGGLRAGVDALASRMPVPVETDVSVGPAPGRGRGDRLLRRRRGADQRRQARARAARRGRRARRGRHAARSDVRDDGVGGARLDGSGLVGLADRLAVLDGRLQVESPADGGTLVAAAIPLAAQGARQ